MRYAYPEYSAHVTPELMAECKDIGRRLLNDVGLVVRNERFVNAIRKHDGLRVDGDRVYISPALYDRHVNAYIEEQRKRLLAAKEDSAKGTWGVTCGGYSIAVIDIPSNQPRPATSQDLRDLIRLAHSLGVTGSYPCTPQEMPSLMRSLACFKICWEESDDIRPFDYLDARQTPYLFEMHKVMGKPFVVVVNVPHAMTVSEHDLDIFLQYYPEWKKDRKSVTFYSICDYAMIGVSKPISSSGCFASYLSQSFGAYVLFKLFDPELNVVPRLSAGHPVDMHQMCWAFGSPRMHLYTYLTNTALPALCGLRPDRYVLSDAFLATSSCAVDVRAGMEKMATGLVAAMQGARSFSGAGNLAVDDLFSGVMMVVDVEIAAYIREVIESFSPHPDLLSTEGLYDVLRDVGTGSEEFYSHADTARKVRTLLPISARRPSEKLRSWMMHGKNMVDVVREECLERIRTQAPYVLAEEKRRELDKIYRRAASELTE